MSVSIPAQKKEVRAAAFPSLWSEFFNSDRFFDVGFPSSKWEKQVPAVNIHENANEFCIEMAAPGLKKDDFNISIENRMLTISSEKEENSEEKDKKGKITRKEYSYNSFSRSFTLPDYVKTDNVIAKYQDGVLSLTIPKKDDAKEKGAKKITVS